MIHISRDQRPQDAWVARRYLKGRYSLLSMLRVTGLSA